MQDWRRRLGLPTTRGAEGFLLALLIDALGTGLYAPFSLLYFHRAIGLPLAEVGLTLTVATTVSLVLNPIAGTLVDRFGARRVVIASQLLQALGFLGYFFVRDLVLLGLAACLVSGGTRMFWASYASLVAAVALPEERDRWYGLAGGAHNLGAGLGGLLAGVLVAVGTTGVYRVLVVADGVSYLIAAALLTFGLREVGRAPVGEVARGGYRDVLRDRPFLGLAASNIIFALCSVMITVGLPVYVTEALGVPGWVVGATFALNTLVLATAQTLTVRLIEPYRRTRSLITAALIWGVACGFFALALALPQGWRTPYLFFAVTAYAVGELVQAPTANALAATASPAALRGRYLATFQLSWGIASALAPALFTLLFTVQATLPWLALASLAAVTALGLRYLEPHLPPDAVRAPGATAPPAA